MKRYRSLAQALTCALAGIGLAVGSGATIVQADTPHPYVEVDVPWEATSAADLQIQLDIPYADLPHYIADPTYVPAGEIRGGFSAELECRTDDGITFLDLDPDHAIADPGRHKAELIFNSPDLSEFAGNMCGLTVYAPSQQTVNMTPMNDKSWFYGDQAASGIVQGSVAQA